MASAAKTTNEELLARLRSDGDGSEVMAQLWENNLGLIRLIVRNVTGLTEREEGFEDMVQQSYFGFSSAAWSYDAASGMAFSTYAGNRIKWSLCRYYEQNGYTVRVPAYMKRRIRECSEKKRQLEAETGRTVTYADALAAMGLSPGAVAGTLAAFQKLKTVSMEESGGGEGLSILDRIAAGEDVEDAAISQEWHRELHEMLFKALGDLSEESRGMIIRRYFHGVSASELAREIGCTRQTVFVRQQTAFQEIRAGRYGSELAEFMPNERKKAQAERRVEMDRAKLGQLQLSDTERGLLAL